MNRNLVRAAAAVAFAAGLAATASVQAQQTFYTFNGNVNTAWTTSGNWSPIGVPDVANEVAIVPFGELAILGGAATIDKLGVEGEVRIANTSSMTILCQTDGLGTTGLLSVTGVLKLQSVGNLTDLIFSGPAGSFVVFGGSEAQPAALLEMSSTAANRIYGANGHEKLFVQPQAVIRGSGQVGVNLLALVHRGDIIANQAISLTVDVNGAGCDSIGGRLIASGGTLNIQSSEIRQNHTPPGLIQSQGTSVVNIISSTVVGGEVSSTGSGGVTVSASSVLDGVLNTGVVNLPNNNTLFLRNGLTQNGPQQLRLNSVGNATDVQLLNSMSISGDGSVVMSNSGANRIFSQNASRLTLAGLQSITGAGQLGVNLLSLTVEDGSIVRAEGSAGMVIDVNADGAINRGLLAAASGSVLTILSSVVDNDGSEGEITALSGGTVNVASSTIIEGTIATQGTGIVQYQSSSLLQDVTVQGADHRLPNTNTLFLSGTLTNNGTMRMQSAGSQTDLNAASPVLITGTGELLLSNNIQNRIFSNNGADRITIGNGFPVRGSGQIGVNLAAITNNGIIEATGSSGLTVDANAQGVDNNGVMRTVAGSILTVSNTPVDNADGVIEAAGGICEIASSQITGGVVRGDGGGFVRAVSSSTLSSVTIEGDVRLPNNNTMFLGGTPQFAGTLRVDSAGNTTNMIIMNPLTLEGSGLVQLSNNIQNRIYANNNADRLTLQPGVVLLGSGQIGLNLMALTNTGFIEASGSSGLTIDANAGGFTNNGILRALPGSSFTILNTVVDNAFGEIFADEGAAATLNNCDVTGGRISKPDGGIVSITGSSTIRNLTIGGVTQLLNNQTVFVDGTITVQGELRMQSSGNFTDMILLQPATLAGNGETVLSSSLNNRIFATDNIDRLTIAPGHTLRGAGSIGIGLMALTNDGTIDCTVPQGMNIATNAGGFLNTGLLRASGGNINIGQGAFTTSGTVVAEAGRKIDRTSGSFVQTGGTVFANGEIEVDSNAYDLQAGVLGGTGLVDSNVTNGDGAVSPGLSAGILTIEGSYTQGLLGEFSVEIGGTNVGTEYDRLVVTGTANLDGRISITRLETQPLIIGASFTVLTAGTVSGTFGTVEVIGMPPARDFIVTYTPTSVVVTIAEGCPADWNGDEGVDDLDIAAFFSDFEQGNADVNLDDGVDDLDIAAFFASFEAGC